MTNFKQLSSSFPADASRSPTSRSGTGEWVNIYSRAHRRQEKYMRDAEILRVNVLKQRESELEKYRREMFTGGPMKSRVNSLTVSKTRAAFKPSTNNTRIAMPSKVSLYSSSTPTLSPTRLKWPSSVPPRLRNPGQTSPRRKKPTLKLPPLRGTLETNYINIANKYGNAARQTDSTTVEYRLPRKEWSPADSTPKDLEGNPSRMSEISKIWEHGTCIYCELERIERSIPPRICKWKPKERNSSKNAGDNVSGNIGGGDDGGGGGGGSYDNKGAHTTDGDDNGEVNNDDGVNENAITEMIRANALEVGPDDQPRHDFEHFAEITSSSDDSSITGDFSVPEERIMECVPPLDCWSDDDNDDVEVDYEALERLAKWYERYPSTPVSYWKRGVHRTLPSFF